jgi:hypothetical protein
MDGTQVSSGLYVPYCTEKDGLSQPISTALSLDAGKNLCQQHFLHRCRTVKQQLPHDQQSGIPASLLDRIRLDWSTTESGTYEGRPQEGLVAALSPLTTTVYKLQATP